MFGHAELDALLFQQLDHHTPTRQNQQRLLLWRRTVDLERHMPKFEGWKRTLSPARPRGLHT